MEELGLIFNLVKNKKPKKTDFYYSMGKRCLSNYYEKYGYLADPHTATGMYILDKVKNDKPIISLACAHPAKFGDAIFKAIKKKVSMPNKLNKIFDQKEKMTILENDKNLVKSYINKLI